MKNMHYFPVPLDRCHNLRRDEQVQTMLRTSPDKLVVPYWRELSLTTGEAAVLVHGTPGAELLDLARQAVFLGKTPEGAPIFAADLSGLEPEPDGGGPNLGLGGQWIGLRAIASRLPAAETAILGYARAMLIWHQRNRFCGSCGAPTESREGGHLRQCLDATCNAPTYPRTDPAVIMLVSDGDNVLLHRQRAWGAGQWSVLAGFVEPGETMEEAVAREVLEETGIVVDRVSYVASQPWPYPSSVMVAFTARAVGGTLVPDPHELEDARWFSRQTVQAEFDDRHRGKGTGLCLPPKGSISRALMNAWLTEGT